jgi:hypothetical protein
MFPAQALTALARGKQELRFRIARERFECFIAVESAVRPLRWLDRFQAHWQTVPTVFKFAAVPVAFFLKRKIFPRKTRRGAWMRWIPLAWRLGKGIR